MFAVGKSASTNDVLKNACTLMMLKTETDERKAIVLFTHTHTHTHTYIYIYIMLLYINTDYILWAP